MSRKLFRLGPGAVVNYEFVARLQKVARHGRAHDPQPHEPHLLHRPLSFSAKPRRSRRLIYIVKRPRESLFPGHAQKKPLASIPRRAMRNRTKLPPRAGLAGTITGFDEGDADGGRCWTAEARSGGWP